MSLGTMIGGAPATNGKAAPPPPAPEAPAPAIVAELEGDPAGDAAVGRAFLAVEDEPAPAAKAKAKPNGKPAAPAAEPAEGQEAPAAAEAATDVEAEPETPAEPPAQHQWIAMRRREQKLAERTTWLEGQATTLDAERKAMAQEREQLIAAKRELDGYREGLKGGDPEKAFEAWAKSQGIDPGEAFGKLARWKLQRETNPAELDATTAAAAKLEALEAKLEAKFAERDRLAQEQAAKQQAVARQQAMVQDHHTIVAAARAQASAYPFLAHVSDRERNALVSDAVKEAHRGGGKSLDAILATLETQLAKDYEPLSRHFGARPTDGADNSSEGIATRPTAAASPRKTVNSRHAAEGSSVEPDAEELNRQAGRAFLNVGQQ